MITFSDVYATLLLAAAVFSFLIVLMHSIVLPRITEVGLAFTGLAEFVWSLKAFEGAEPSSATYLLGVAGVALIYAGLRFARRKSSHSRNNPEALSHERK